MYNLVKISRLSQPWNLNSDKVVLQCYIQYLPIYVGDGEGGPVAKMVVVPEVA